MAMGTLAYMSPEQALGLDSDARTDLFSLGLVLYEMATGRPAFSGTSAGALTDAILHKDPVPATRLNPELPEEFSRVLVKALEKDRDVRYQHAADLRADLKRLKRDSDSGRTSTTGLPTAHARVPEERGGGAPTRLSWKWPVAALATLAVAAVLFVVFRSPLAPPQVVATRQITNDQKSKLKEGGVPPPPLLTDGSRIYLQEDTYATNMILAQVSPNGGETSPIALPLPLASPDMSPGIQALSPDGREIFFQADAGQTSTRKAPLWALPLPPGQARRVGNLDVSGATWSPDGASIVYTQDDGVFQARPDGSDSRKLATVSGLALWPRWSPDGRVVRFSVWNTTLFSSTLWEVNADGSNLHQMLADWRPPVNDCCGNWTRDGNYFVFQSTRDGRASLWATRERLHFWQKASAEPAPLAVGQMQAFAPLPSRDGREVYFIGAIMRGELARLDLKTHQFAPYLGGLSAEGLAFSRDGTRVA